MRARPRRRGPGLGELLAAAMGTFGSTGVGAAAYPTQGGGTGPGLPAHAGDHSVRPRGGHLHSATAASGRLGAAGERAEPAWTGCCCPATTRPQPGTRRGRWLNEKFLKMLKASNKLRD